MNKVFRKFKDKYHIVDLDAHVFLVSKDIVGKEGERIVIFIYDDAEYNIVVSKYKAKAMSHLDEEDQRFLLGYVFSDDIMDRIITKYKIKPDLAYKEIPLYGEVVDHGLAELMSKPIKLKGLMNSPDFMNEDVVFDAVVKIEK